MSQKLHMAMSEWIEDIKNLIEDFMKNYDEQNDIGYMLEVHMKYSEELGISRNDLAFRSPKK